MLYCFSTETSKSWKLTLTHNTYISVHLCVSTHRYTCIHTRSSIQFSHLVVPTLYDPMDYSMPGLPAHRQLPEFTQTHVHWIGNVIQPSLSVIPFFSCLQSFPASGSFQMSQLIASGGQSIGVSASTSVLPKNIQNWSPLGWTVWISPCSPRDSQESSPIPQFKSINSSVLSFLYSPSLTSIHDYWKNHSLD